MNPWEIKLEIIPASTSPVPAVASPGFPVTLISVESQNNEKEVPIDPRYFKKNLSKEKYKIYTGNYDEIKKAEELEKEEEITRLRKNLDQQLINLQNLVAKLANKLQRQLLAKENRSWEFDLEEGNLEASKL